MDIIDFWKIYGNDMPSAEFVWQFGKGDPQTAVQEYLRQRPVFWGIVRRSGWKETFATDKQYGRQHVAAAMLCHLEMTRDEWADAVACYQEAEARARAAEKARREAEALAAAVARVEEEARARAQAQRDAELLDASADAETEETPTRPASAEYTPPDISGQHSAPPEGHSISSPAEDAACPPFVPSTTRLDNTPPDADHVHEADSKTITTAADSLEEGENSAQSDDNVTPEQ